MNETKGERLLYRNALSTLLWVTAVLGVLLALLVGMSLRSVHRLDLLAHNLEQYEQLVRHQQRRLAEGSGSRRASKGEWTSSPEPTASSNAAAGHQIFFLEPVPDRTGSATEPVASRTVPDHGVHDSVSKLQALLAGLKDDSRRELQAALAIAMILPLLGIAFWTFFRRRVLQPLASLESGMSQLARKDFRSVDVGRIDATLRPLFQKYNRLVGRMRDLEEAHVKRESALCEELQQTTRALVEQQTALARADRLALLSDLGARMAHRLRSPLTAALVTLGNLREESGSPEQRERLGKAIDAIERGLQELAALLQEARQEPEGAGRVELHTVVDDLFALLGHPIEGRAAELDNAVPPGLVCTLPEAATRHALMNLLRNALEADHWSLGRRVHVGAEATGKAVRITVEANRPGFSETELRLGLPGSSPWSRRGGPLDLAIVRRFADHLGGTLTLENPSRGGAKATLWIPQVQTDG